MRRQAAGHGGLHRRGEPACFGLPGQASRPSSSGVITMGMRSWIWPMSSVAWVVMIGGRPQPGASSSAGTRTVSPELVDCRRRQRCPRPSGRCNTAAWAAFPARSPPATRSSHRPGRMQRRLANARRNAGLTATVSARALISRAPPEASLAQDGTGPSAPRAARARTAGRLPASSRSRPFHHGVDPPRRGDVVVRAGLGSDPSATRSRSTRTPRGAQAAYAPRRTDRTCRTSLSSANPDIRLRLDWPFIARNPCCQTS